MIKYKSWSRKKIADDMIRVPSNQYLGQNNFEECEQALLAISGNPLDFWIWDCHRASNRSSNLLWVLELTVCSPFFLGVVHFQWLVRLLSKRRGCGNFCILKIVAAGGAKSRFFIVSTAKSALMNGVVTYSLSHRLSDRDLKVAGQCG